MRIYKDGIYKTIDSSEFGFYQRQGFKKVEEKVEPKKEEVTAEIKTEPIGEVLKVETTENTEEVILKPKKKR